MSSKRQQTMAKMTRERTVRERRAKKLEKKLEKKQAAAAERQAKADGTWVEPEDADSDRDPDLEPDLSSGTSEV